MAQRHGHQLLRVRSPGSVTLAACSLQKRASPRWCTDQPSLWPSVSVFLERAGRRMFCTSEPITSCAGTALIPRGSATTGGLHLSLRTQETTGRGCATAKLRLQNRRLPAFSPPESCLTCPHPSTVVTGPEQSPCSSVGRP